MCFQPNTSAQDAALREEQATSAAAQAKSDAQLAQTHATVKQDQGTVDKAFGQFDDPYFQGYKNAYTGYYTPQVNDQYKQAQDQLTAALAGNGTLESSVGAQALANLAKRNTDQVAQIQSDASAATTAQRQSVDSQKTSLYNQANAAVDPTQIASSANAQTTALAAPPAYTPLSNVFSDLVTPFANYTKSAANSPIGGVAIPSVVTQTPYTGAPNNPITG